MVCSFLCLLITTLQQQHLVVETTLEHVWQCTEKSGPSVRPMWVPANGHVHSRETETPPALMWMPRSPLNSNYLAGPQRLRCSFQHFPVFAD